MDSQTGPGDKLRDAIWSSGSTPGQTKELWSDPARTKWIGLTSYRVEITHLPTCDCRIKIVVHDSEREIINSGWILDCSLRGGKLGAFVFSQQGIIWSQLNYKCIGK